MGGQASAYPRGPVHERVRGRLEGLRGAPGRPPPSRSVARRRRPAGAAGKRFARRASPRGSLPAPVQGRAATRCSDAPSGRTRMVARGSPLAAGGGRVVGTLGCNVAARACTCAVSMSHGATPTDAPPARGGTRREPRRARVRVRTRARDPDRRYEMGDPLPPADIAVAAARYRPARRRARHRAAREGRPEPGLRTGQRLVGGSARRRSGHPAVRLASGSGRIPKRPLLHRPGRPPSRRPGGHSRTQISPTGCTCPAARWSSSSTRNRPARAALRSPARSGPRES